MSNHVTKQEREALILEARALIQMEEDGRHFVCTNFQEATAAIQIRHGISQQRAGHAVGTAVLRVRAKLIKERDGIR